jgi:hypothetical protein
VLFSDDFNSGCDSDWNFPHGGWACDGEVLRQANYCGLAACDNHAWIGSQDWADCTVTLEYTPTEASSNGPQIYVKVCTDPASIAGMNNEGQWVSGYGIDLGWNSELKINKYNSTSAGTLAIASGAQFGMNIGTTYVVKFGRVGAALFAKVYAKGAVEPDWMLTAFDGDYATGIVGIGTWNTLGYIDNIEIQGAGAVPAESTTWGNLKTLYR